jgi:hypothetical protein
MIRTAAAASLALALSANATLAGGLVPPAEQPPPVVIVEDEAPHSIAGALAPLLLLGALIAVAVASSDDDDEDEPDPLPISDVRLKTDVTRIGTSPSGLPIYSFRYLWSDRHFEGTMAQDLLTLKPEAVIHAPFGALLVDYAQTDVSFRSLD